MFVWYQQIATVVCATNDQVTLNSIPFQFRFELCVVSWLNISFVRHFNKFATNILIHTLQMRNNHENIEITILKEKLICRLKENAGYVTTIRVEFHRLAQLYCFPRNSLFIDTDSPVNVGHLSYHCLWYVCMTIPNEVTSEKCATQRKHKMKRNFNLFITLLFKVSSV